MNALAMGMTGPRRLTAYAAILRVWLYRIRYATPLLSLLLVGIVAFVAAIAERRFFVATAQFCAVIGLVCLWAGFFAAVQRQNHPLPARLMPGQLRCLREVTVLGFLAVVPPSAWLLASSPLQWHLPAALILSSLASVLLALIVRWPWLWIAGWFLTSLVGASVPAWVKAATKARMIEIYNDQPVSMAAFLMVLSALALCCLFQSGGPGHVKSWNRHSQLRDLLNSQSGSAPRETPTEAWFVRLVDGCSRAFAWLRLLWTAWLIRHAQPTARSVMARVALTASPQTHWTSIIGTLLLLGVGIAVALAGALLFSSDGMEIGSIVVQSFAFSYLAMLMNPLVATTGALLRRRREQALLLLLPGVPRGRALNRHLAIRQMVTHAGNWVLGVVLMLALQALASHLKESDVSMSFWGRAAVSFAVMSLPMGVLQWRNWSVQRETSPTWTVILTSVLLCGTMGLAALVGDRPFLQPASLLGASVLITLVLMALRWPSINRYPSFWPVGRDA